MKKWKRNLAMIAAAYAVGFLATSAALAAEPPQKSAFRANMDGTLTVYSEDCSAYVCVRQEWIVVARCVMNYEAIRGASVRQGEFDSFSAPKLDPNCSEHWRAGNREYALTEAGAERAGEIGLDRLLALLEGSAQ